MHLRGALEAVAGPGAVVYLPQALALAVVLELAPLAAGLVVAGRMGASLGAGLGAMTLTEQIDALEVQGISPRRELTAPRVLACMIAHAAAHPVHQRRPPSPPAGSPRPSAEPSPAASSSTNVCTSSR